MKAPRLYDPIVGGPDNRQPHSRVNILEVLEHIRKIIIYGGSAVGKAATMPANPDLDAKPEVVAELVKVVRGLGK